MRVKHCLNCGKILDKDCKGLICPECSIKLITGYKENWKKQRGNSETPLNKNL